MFLITGEFIDRERKQRERAKTCLNGVLTEAGLIDLQN